MAYVLKQLQVRRSCLVRRAASSAGGVLRLRSSGTLFLQSSDRQLHLAPCWPNGSNGLPGPCCDWPSPHVACIYGVGILRRLHPEPHHGQRSPRAPCKRPARRPVRPHGDACPSRYFDTHAHGDIMSVYTNDIDTLRQIISQSLPQLVIQRSFTHRQRVREHALS